ncbi:MAG: pyrroline-5-carboxylate reductase [Proteobacteria bacterium]|nr:pyrroline-5-carboxylate reductase [Pseudomonadota bacterium]
MSKPVLVGCGNMGSVLADAIIEKGICSAKELTVIEKYTNQYTQKLQEKGTRVLEHFSELSGNQDLVIIAVKPQDSSEVLDEIVAGVDENTLVISIMAGITLEVLKNKLPEAQIIRCMPNTPCAIQQGMAVYCGNGRVSDKSYVIAQSILSTMGKAFRVKKEIMIDAATGISGSGPAYVFYLAEALKEGAIKLGFDEEQADLLATQTLLGSSTLLHQSKDSPEELRRKVTSPNGTTLEATKHFDAKGLKQILIEGFEAAYNRSIELGKPKEN